MDDKDVAPLVIDNPICVRLDMPEKMVPQL